MLPLPRVRRPGRLLVQAAFALAAGSACAGGHFDVDDADIIGPGHCQYEVWTGRAEASATNFQHLGPACRIGPVELGINLDRFHAPDARSGYAGPAVKWTWWGRPDDPLRAAIVFAAAWGTHNRGRQVVLPLTWQPLPSLLLHANLGADWRPVDGIRSRRLGVAAEWAVDDKLSLILERNRALGAWTTRAGLRLGLTPRISLDMSAAKVRPDGTVFTVGLNHEFSR